MQDKQNTPAKITLGSKLAVGAVAGVFGTCIVFPIDTIKTRMQSSPIRVSPLTVSRDIWAKTGPLGFYRGLGANLIGVTPEKAIKLAVNDTLREYFADGQGHVSVGHQVLAGAGAGVCQVVATNPMEIVKIRLQMQSLSPQQQQLSLGGVLRELKVRGLYQGTLVTLLRDVPYSMVFFPLYAGLKDVFSPGILGTLGAGMCAGGFAAALATPADVVKTRYQSRGGKERYGSVWRCVRTVVREEGASALSKGMLPRACVQAPLFGIALLAFELQKQWLVGV